MQRAPAAAAPAAGLRPVPGIVRDALRGSGEHLDRATRAEMETHFGADFADVRVHTDVQAARSARAIDALAYTVGREVVFAQGQYAPGSQSGRRLIAHELAHVVQQRGSTPSLDRLALDGPGDSAAEHEAQAAGAAFAAGNAAAPIRARAGGAIQRDRGSPGGGCGLCFGGNLGDVGTLAHQRVQGVFTGTYGGFLMTELELDALALTPAPGDENGRLDLAHFSGPGKISIGEIKPSNAGGLLGADRDLLWYEQQLENRGFTVDRLMLRTPASLATGAETFPTRAPPGCPQFQSLFCDQPVQPGGIYLYWCSPDFKDLVGTCDCEDGPRNVGDKVDEKTKEKDTEDTDTDTQTDKQPKDEPHNEGDGKQDDEKPKEDGDEEGEPGKVIPFPRPKPVPPEVVVPIAAAVAMFLLAQAAKKNPVARYAMLAMFIVALSRGRAEASVGPGDSDSDPIEAAFGKGTGLPPELKQMVENDPKLKQLVTEGAAKGDFTDAQEEASRQAMQIVNDNLDQFSDEDLALMFSTTDAASKVAPSLNQTAEGLRKALDKHRAAAAAADGQTPAPGKDGGSGGTQTDPQAPPDPAATLPPDVSARLSAENPSVLALYRALRTGAGNGAKITGSLVTRFLDLVEPLTDAQRDQLQAAAIPAPGETEDEFIAALKQAIAALPSAGPGADADAGATPAANSGSAQPESQDAATPGSQQQDATPGAGDPSQKSDKASSGGTVVSEPRPYSGTADGPPPPIRFITDLSTVRTKGSHTIKVSFTSNGRTVVSHFTVIVTDVSPTVVTLKTANTQPLNLAPPGEPAVVVQPNRTIKLPLTSQKQ